MNGPRLVFFTPQGQVVLLLMIAGIIGALLWLMARRKLTMGLGLFWLVGFCGLATLVGSRHTLIVIAGLLGTLYPEAAIRVLAFMALLGTQIYLSVRLSAQEDRVVELAQAVALLENELRAQGTEPVTLPEMGAGAWALPAAPHGLPGEEVGPPTG